MAQAYSLALPPETWGRLRGWRGLSPRTLKALFSEVMPTIPEACDHAAYWSHSRLAFSITEEPSSLWAAAHQVALEDALIHVFCGHGTLGIGECLVWCQAMRNASCQRDDAEWGCPCLFFLPFWKLLWMWLIFSWFLFQQVCYWEKSWVCSSVDIVFI